MLENGVDYSKVHPTAVTFIKLMPPVKSIAAIRFGSNLKTFIGSNNLRLHNFKIKANGNKVKCRMYYPKAVGKLKAVIYFHGGGFVYGGLNSSDGGLRDLCSSGEIVVFSVNYSLAPEYPFPNAVNECLDIAKQIFKQAEKLGIDKNNISLGGDSAGGNLAIVTTIRLIELNYKPKTMFLFYPFVEVISEGIEEKYPSLNKFGKGYFLTKEALTDMTNWYVPRHLDCSEPMISPINADLSVLPPTIVIACGHDPLVDMDKAFYKKLLDVKVKSKYVEYPEMIHGFFSVFKEFANLAIAEILRFMSEIL